MLTLLLARPFAAALIIALVPICILIAVFQERVVGGLTAGGVKG